MEKVFVLQNLRGKKGKGEYISNKSFFLCVGKRTLFLPLIDDGKIFSSVLVASNAEREKKR
jgi:hypothetical protein